MTKEDAVQKVVSFARAQIGTHETGDNFTKFAAEADANGWTMDAYGFTMQGKAWCDFFVDYCFWKCFGFNVGQQMLFQKGKTGGAACMNSAGFFRGNGSWHGKPEVGDQVIYAGENHTGLVVAVNSNGSYDTVDGNYSDSVKLRKGLFISAASGFGRPDWSLVADVDASAETETEIEKSSEDTNSDEISAGDIVSVKRGAKFWNTETALPAMWYSCNWIVLQVDENGRAVLDQKENGASGYMSPISVDYLEKVVISEKETATDDVVIADSSNTTATSYGVQGTMTAKISGNSENSAGTGIINGSNTESGPVIMNNTSSPIHTFGGRITNVQNRSK